jgi:hypothetical protein
MRVSAVVPVGLHPPAFRQEADWRHARIAVPISGLDNRRLSDGCALQFGAFSRNVYVNVCACPLFGEEGSGDRSFGA